MRSEETNYIREQDARRVERRPYETKSERLDKTWSGEREH